MAFAAGRDDPRVQDVAASYERGRWRTGLGADGASRGGLV